jgi:glycerate 2-kinase
LLPDAIRDPAIAPVLARPGLRVLAVGKAAPFMARTFAELVDGRIAAGIVIGTHLPIELPGNLSWLQSSHPLPDERSVTAGRCALEVARAVPLDAALVVLLSGGASALMAVPADGLTLEDKRQTVNAMLRGGADITQLNTVRKHLSAVKGGRLAAATPAPTVCLAISDVVGDDLSVIGSGPTVPDASTYREAWLYAEELNVVKEISAAAAELLKAGARGDVEETPKPGDVRLAHAVTRVIGGRKEAMAGARETAAALGYETATIDEPIVGEARTAGPALLERARAIAAARRRPFCVIAGGETTVKVVGKGRGGRNQELALSAAVMLADLGDDVALASVGTDGIDGPTDAAGAFVDSTTIARARTQSLDPSAFLADNDAYAFFQILSDLVVTGPTATNVGDVQVVLFRK